MKCYQAKAGELSRQWFVIDASDQVVGRLAAQIAPILMGKHRPTYTPHIDTGDCVIVTNVDKVVFTGNKWRQKSYQRYSGYPGGQREEAAWKLFERRPERILELAIQRMMPKSKMGRHMMDKLMLYVGPNHPHQAQVPVPLEPLSGRPAPAGALFAPNRWRRRRSQRRTRLPSSRPRPPRRTRTRRPPLRRVARAPHTSTASTAPPTSFTSTTKLPRSNPTRRTSLTSTTKLPRPNPIRPSRKRPDPRANPPSPKT